MTDKDCQLPFYYHKLLIVNETFMLNNGNNNNFYNNMLTDGEILYLDFSMCWIFCSLDTNLFPPCSCILGRRINYWKFLIRIKKDFNFEPFQENVIAPYICMAQ